MPEIKFPSEWLKIGVNVNAGDLIRFNDAGTFNEETERYVFNVTIISGSSPVEVKKFTLNKTNFDIVSKLYGSNSDAWVGKEMSVGKIKVRNPQTGTMVDSIVLEEPPKDPLATTTPEATAPEVEGSPF